MARALLSIAEDVSQPVQVRLAAIKDVLDRAGVNQRLELDVKVEAPWQGLIAGIVSEVPDEELPRLVDYDRAKADPDVIESTAYEDDEADVVDAVVVERTPVVAPSRAPARRRSTRPAANLPPQR